MTIHSLQFGKKGQPIAFLHGWQQTSQSFTPLVPFLYRRYRLFFLDLPGFGKSKLPSSPLSSFDYAQLVVKWLKQNNLKRAILVGHSFGGKIATIIAAKHPKMVIRLILIASTGIPHTSKYYWVKKLIPPPLTNLLAPLLRPFLASRDYKQAGKLLTTFKAVVKEDLLSTFAKIKTPTLIIWGEDDKELSIKDGQKIQQLIKESRLVKVGKSHFPFWEDPQKVAKLIDQFIKK